MTDPNRATQVALADAGMRLKKREKVEGWGEPFQGRRDWNAYRRQLLGRGQMLIHLTYFKKWSDELDAMKREKQADPSRSRNPSSNTSRSSGHAPD